VDGVVVLGVVVLGAAGVSCGFSAVGVAWSAFLVVSSGGANICYPWRPEQDRAWRYRQQDKLSSLALPLDKTYAVRRPGATNQQDTVCVEPGATMQPNLRCNEPGVTNQQNTHGVEPGATIGRMSWVLEPLLLLAWWVSRVLGERQCFLVEFSSCGLAFSSAHPSLSLRKGLSPGDEKIEAVDGAALRALGVAGISASVTRPRLREARIRVVDGTVLAFRYRGGARRRRGEETRLSGIGSAKVWVAQNHPGPEVQAQDLELKVVVQGQNQTIQD
jgi:hypothetical protein